jgi:hypothetical protein
MHELDIATRFELVFHGSFHADTRPTLVVICFALGSWVGCIRPSAAGIWRRRAIVTPGNHKAKIFRVVEALGAHFDQVVLAGYPPFLKEVDRRWDISERPVAKAYNYPPIADTTAVVGDRSIKGEIAALKALIEANESELRKVFQICADGTGGYFG